MSMRLQRALLWQVCAGQVTLLHLGCGLANG